MLHDGPGCSFISTPLYEWAVRSAPCVMSDCGKLRWEQQKHSSQGFTKRFLLTRDYGYVHLFYTVYVNLNSASNGLKTNKTPKVLPDFDREFTALIGTFCGLLSLWVMNLWYIFRNYISLVQYNINTFLTNLLLRTRYAAHI